MNLNRKALQYFISEAKKEKSKKVQSNMEINEPSQDVWDLMKGTTVANPNNKGEYGATPATANTPHPNGSNNYYTRNLITDWDAFIQSMVHGFFWIGFVQKVGIDRESSLKLTQALGTSSPIVDLYYVAKVQYSVGGGEDSAIAKANQGLKNKRAKAKENSNDNSEVKKESYFRFGNRLNEDNTLGDILQQQGNAVDSVLTNIDLNKARDEWNKQYGPDAVPQTIEKSGNPLTDYINQQKQNNKNSKKVPKKPSYDYKNERSKNRTAVGFKPTKYDRNNGTRPNNGEDSLDFYNEPAQRFVAFIAVDKDRNPHPIFGPELNKLASSLSRQALNRTFHIEEKVQRKAQMMTTQSGTMGSIPELQAILKKLEDEELENLTNGTVDRTPDDSALASRGKGSWKASYWKKAPFNPDGTRNDKYAGQREKVIGKERGPRIAGTEKEKLHGQEDIIDAPTGAVVDKVGDGYNTTDSLKYTAQHFLNVLLKNVAFISTGTSGGNNADGSGDTFIGQGNPNIPHSIFAYCVSHLADKYDADAYLTQDYGNEHSNNRDSVVTSADLDAFYGDAEAESNEDLNSYNNSVAQKKKDYNDIMNIEKSRGFSKSFADAYRDWATNKDYEGNMPKASDFYYDKPSIADEARIRRGRMLSESLRRMVRSQIMRELKNSLR